MSAYKTATIHVGESEYKRLREAEEQLRLIEMQQKSYERDLEERSIFERIVDQQSDRESKVYQYLSQVNEDLASIEENATNWLQNEAQKLENSFIRQYEDLNYSAEAAIEQLFNEFSYEISNQHDQLREYQEAQIEFVNDEQNKKELKIREAAKWIETAAQLLRFVQAEFRSDPKVIQDLELQRLQINQAIDYYNQGYSDFAFVIANQCHLELVKIRISLETQEAIHTAHLHELKIQGKDLREKIDQIKEIHPMDNDGNELEDFIDLDFWTNGEYSRLQREIYQITNHVEGMDRIDQETYLAYLREIEKLKDRSLVIVTDARIAVLSSQLRFNVAQIVVQALETQGFHLEEANYQNKDYRNSFTALTRNLSGNEVMVTIDPTIDLDEGGKLEIFSEDADQITEHELLQRNREIFKAIQDHGLIVQNLKSSNDNLYGSLDNSVLSDHTQQKIMEKSKYGRG